MENELAEEAAQAAENAGLENARFGDRLAAFTFDGLLFWSGYWASLAAISGGEPWLSPKARVMLAPWAAAFFLYHAWFSSGGRQTIGKRLFGLKVVDGDGGPLGLDQGLTRALGYLPSSIFNLGFLIAPFSAEGLALHDRLAGSRVAQVRQLSRVGRVFASGAGLAAFLFLSGVWTWQNVAKPSYTRMKDVAYAEHSLENLGELQELYKHRTGRYTTDVLDLAGMTGHTADFMNSLAYTVQPGYGVQISLNPQGGYVIAARANDAQNTAVVYAGPVRDANQKS